MAISRSNRSVPASRSAESARLRQPAHPKKMTGSSSQPEPRRAMRRADASDVTVHALQPQQKPLWLTLLLRLQQTVSVTTLLLTAGVLITYGWTVYIQQRWGQQYDKLESLKKQERQLISANEVLKNQMAEQAENPKAGLLLPDPSNAIFLSPAPQRPEVKPTSVTSTEPSPTKPLGY